MNKPEIVINIEDIYYKNYDTYSKKLLDKNENENENENDNKNSYCFYNFIERFFCCFL
jgi:hypothetical protein